MSEFRIKVSIGSFNVELEGNTLDVISQFEEIKKNGLGQIVDQLTPLVSKGPMKYSSDEENLSSISLTKEMALLEVTGSVKSLQDVVMRSLPTSEAEWILIYGYFHKQGGNPSFTRKDIIEKYTESNRKTEQRIKNLSASIVQAVNKLWLSALNENDFIVTSPGIEKATEILSRTKSTIKPKKQSPSTKTEEKSDVKG